MPTYEYICEKCGHQFDKFQTMSAKPLSVCPRDKCAQKSWGKGRVKRNISGGAGLIFKGSGFYITDYRSDKYREAAKKDTPSPSSAPTTGGSSSASGEAKGAAAKSDSGTAKPKAGKAQT
jgi:putative FmdB family regulatory protein